MTVEYMRRFATGLAQYEFAEVRSDNFQEFVEAAANLADYVSGQGGGDVTPAQAEANVKSAFGRTTEQKPAFGGGGSKFGGSSSTSDAGPDKYELGEADGWRISVWRGKRGWAYNAYKKGEKAIYADLPQGKDPATATFDEAMAALKAKVA